MIDLQRERWRPRTIRAGSSADGTDIDIGFMLAARCASVVLSSAARIVGLRTHSIESPQVATSGRLWITFTLSAFIAGISAAPAVQAEW